MLGPVTGSEEMKISGIDPKTYHSAKWTYYRVRGGN